MFLKIKSMSKVDYSDSVFFQKKKKLRSSEEYSNSSL